MISLAAPGAAIEIVAARVAATAPPPDPAELRRKINVLAPLAAAIQRVATESAPSARRAAA